MNINLRKSNNTLMVSNYLSLSTIFLPRMLLYKQWMFYYILGHLRVLGHNGSGQNGTDKMVWKKWYMDKMVLDKMVRTKWYIQNGTDKILRIVINQSRSH